MPLHLRGVAALLIVTLVWGTTIPAMKDMTGYLSASWIERPAAALAPE
jgi:hypothetical protein